MASNQRRAAYRLLFCVRLVLALGVLGLFICVYVSSLLKWGDLRVLLASHQFTGALMRGGVFFLAVLAVTAVAGRWYCSVLCPFGTLLELVWRISQTMAGWRTRFISPSRLRFVVPALAGIGFVAIPSLLVPMDPISNFGRGVRSVYILVTEGVASKTPMIWAMLCMFAVVLMFSAVRGRRFCDWCPVGVLLGAFVYAAPLGMRLKKYTCVSCGRCERACPMNCVDSKKKVIDEMRCVLCFGCAGACALGALGYGTVLPAKREGRREFLRKSGVFFAAFAGVIYLGGAVARRLYPRFLKSSGISGQIPFIMPPGAADIDWYLSNCIGCQACVAACPAEIIRIGDDSFPRLNYTNGYCQYNCTECADVCPADALLIRHGMKQRTRIGLSVLYIGRCVVLTNGEACGACAEVCAPRALTMEPLEPGSTLTKPVLDEEYCIGCGGCLHVCPAEPRAFVITGVTPQTSTPGIRPSDTEEDDAAQGVYVSGDDFPF